MRRCYLPYDLKLYNTHKLWRFVVATRCLKLFRYKDRIHVSVFDTKSSKLICRRLRPIPITELSKNIRSPKRYYIIWKVSHGIGKKKYHMVLWSKKCPSVVRSLVNLFFPACGWLAASVMVVGRSCNNPGKKRWNSGKKQARGGIGGTRPMSAGLYWIEW
jgi:hypothetical protein